MAMEQAFLVPQIQVAVAVVVLLLLAATADQA
jgi:hypothetical protein